MEEKGKMRKKIKHKGKSLKRERGGGVEERGHPLFQPWVPRKAKRESKSDRINSLMFSRTEKRRKTGDKRKRENKGKNKKSKRTMLVFQYVYPQYRTPYRPNHKHVHRGKRTSGAQVHLKRCMIIQSIARYDLVSPERQGRLYKCEVSADTFEVNNLGRNP